MKISARFNKRISKESILGSRDVLEVVQKILQEDMDADVKHMRSRDNLESHNYSELIADHMATQRTLQKVIDLLTIKG